MSDYEEKFGSLSRVYGDEMMKMLAEVHICIVGLGGVGSWTAEGLARSGITKITLVDGDTISRSNTNRQIHTLESTIGQSKVETMKGRILDINPECEVQTIEQYIDGDNQRDILEGQPRLPGRTGRRQLVQQQLHSMRLQMRLAFQEPTA